MDGAAPWTGLYVKGFSSNPLKSICAMMHDEPPTCDTLLNVLYRKGLEAKLARLACVG